MVYDHECDGESDGDVKGVTFSRRVEDAVAVIDHLTEVVTSGGNTFIWCLTDVEPSGNGWLQSGWLSMIAARQISERLHGMGG